MSLPHSLFVKVAIICGVSSLILGGTRLLADFQGSTYLMPFDDAPLHYSTRTPQDVVAQLQSRLEKGEAKLEHESEHGYLLSLLKQLQIPLSSQLLVFSKTSLQREWISPQTPRAIYFNDDVYIGYIPGAPLIEISVADPKLGAIFYTIEQEKTDAKVNVLTRSTQCLECHASARSMGVPGHLVRTFQTDGRGFVDFSGGAQTVTHRMPLADRFGGWYVTGTHGAQSHKGNLFGAKAFDRHEKEPAHGGNIADLKTFFKADGYPSSHSDIVAHLVLSHQIHMHNFIARLNFESQTRITRYGEVKYMDSMVDSFLQYLLFSEEAPLIAPIKGTSKFAEEFEARGPKDKQGRSLRDFDLQTRLFKYPCSFLIYSEAFDALPPKLKEIIYTRLHDILTGKNNEKEFQNLTPETRRAILKILTETKTDLPENWKM
ncbi:MAG TPA: hypothetical protein VGB77_07530 [Abditibacteriaceae bacterium]|jgi:hypothetical protein